MLVQHYITSGMMRVGFRHARFMAWCGVKPRNSIIKGSIRTRSPDKGKGYVSHTGRVSCMGMA